MLVMTVYMSHIPRLFFDMIARRRTSIVTVSPMSFEYKRQLVERQNCLVIGHTKSLLFSFSKRRSLTSLYDLNLSQLVFEGI